MTSPTPAQRKLLDLVRRRGPVVAADLAAQLETSDVAVRQHLRALEDEGLIEALPMPHQGRGRPATGWAVTAAAREFLPDSHAELTVGLLDAIEGSVGAAGLDKILAARAQQQAVSYRQAMGTGALGKRVKVLARLRDREGYMAEARRDGSTWLLIEHHCPVCVAASRCRGICSTELEVFRAAFGSDTMVERTEHVLEEGQRCVYAIRPRG